MRFYDQPITWFMFFTLALALVAGCGTDPAPAPAPADQTTQAAIENELRATQRARSAAVSSSTATPTSTATVASEPAISTSTMLPDSSDPAPTDSTSSNETVNLFSVEPAGYLVSRLPALSSLPPGFAITHEGRSTAENIAQVWTNPAAHEQRLEDWNYQRGAVRFYNLLDATDADARTRIVHARAHIMEFDTAEHATAAMTFEHDSWLTCSCGMQTASVELLGDHTLAVHGTNTQSQTGLPAMAKAWVRVDATVWDISVESLEYDGLVDAVEILRATLAQPDTRLAVTLPWVLNLPQGYVVADDRPQTLAEIAQRYPLDVAGQTQRLQEWGFIQAQRRIFELPGADAAGLTDRLLRLETLVIEVGSPDEAAASFTVAFEQLLATDATSVAVDVEPIQNQSLAIRGQRSVDGQIEDVGVLLVQAGNRVYAYTGTSYGYDVLPDLVRIANASLDRTGH